MIYFEGIERVIAYPQGSNTGEVAEKLEDDYQVVERFADYIEQRLESEFMKYLNRAISQFGDYDKAFERALFLSSQWLTSEWRLYIKNAKHGLTTKASQKRGDPAFVDTGNYFQNMIIQLVQK